MIMDMVPEIFLFHNIVLDAALFILFAVRYLWGPPTDMLRLILFLFSGWAIVSDMNLYYDWHVPWFDLELNERQIFGKAVIGFVLMVDLFKDYLNIRRRDQIRLLVTAAKPNH